MGVYFHLGEERNNIVESLTFWLMTAPGAEPGPDLRTPSISISAKVQPTIVVAQSDLTSINDDSSETRSTREKYKHSASLIIAL